MGNKDNYFYCDGCGKGLYDSTLGKGRCGRCGGLFCFDCHGGGGWCLWCVRDMDDLNKREGGQHNDSR